MRRLSGWHGAPVALLLLLILSACGAGDEPAPPAAEPEEESQDEPEEDPEGDPVEDPEEPEATPEDLGWAPTEDVRWIIPFSPGGGYDAYSRKLAEVGNTYMPSGVRIVVENIDGAGSRVGTQTLLDSSPDGHTLQMVCDVCLTPYNIFHPDDQYPLSDFEWVFGVTNETFILYSFAHSGIESIDDLRDRAEPVRVGSISIENIYLPVTVVVADQIGFSTQWVTAYPGAGELIAGGLRGDFDLSVFQHSSIVDYAETGDAIPLLIIGPEPLEGYDGVPTTAELGFPELWVTDQRPVTLPPGSTPEQVTFWTETFRQVFEDPEMTTWSEEANRPLHFRTPDEVLEAIADTEQVMDQYSDVILEEAATVED